MEESVAVICKCSKTGKLFGIRFDKIAKDVWEYAWAFPLKDGADKREKGFTTTIKGKFVEGKNYPGCPHCESKSFFGCSCGKLSCWDEKSFSVHCYHCGDDIVLNTALEEINATDSL